MRPNPPCPECHRTADVVSSGDETVYWCPECSMEVER